MGSHFGCASKGRTTKQRLLALRQRLHFGVALVGLLLLIGVSAALADEPGETGPPPMPTPVEMEEGLNVDNSAIHEAELTDLEAAEELPHQELNREQALDLMQEVFAPLLEAPAGIFNELDVERFVSDNAVIIAAGDMPEASGITVGAPPQERYEGDLLLESTLPLRTESDSGKAEIVDLGIEQAGGDLEPANPLVDVAIPQDLGEGIDLPEVGIQVGLSDAPTDRAPSTLNQSVAAYPEVAKDTSLAIALTPGGFETLTLLQSAQAPTSQTFELELPNGANLRSTEEGGAEVVLEGEPLMGITAPSALDAAGENVPSTMAVEGDTLTLSVSPNSSTSFPIMLDPLYETYNWWNGITGLGGWAGYTNATPNYYFADHATCTTYASPYSCQSGVTSNAPGLYLGGLPGSVPVNSQASWNFKVPRWNEEWANNNRPPDSFITSMTLEHIGFWHRTDSAPSPTLWSGIWNTETPGWVSGHARGGNSPDWYDTKLEFSAGQNTEGRQATFSLSNTDGHNLTAFRDAFVSAAAITIADPKIPSVVGLPSSPSKWLDRVPTQPIKATFSDRGLGIYRLKVIPDGVSPPQWPVQNVVGCTGTTIYPCPGTKTFELSNNLGGIEGSGEVRDYDPSVLPQGKNYVTLYAEDPLGNKSSSNNKALVKVDHSPPSLALSGTMTEQASVGTNAAQYTLKYTASDGDSQAATALASIGSAGTAPGNTQRPLGTAIDGSGNLWVVDRDNNRVEKFDENGNFLMQFGTLGSGNGQFNDPRGIAITSNGTIWVSEAGNKRVQAFNSNGEYLRKITYASSVNPMESRPAPGRSGWRMSAQTNSLSSTKAGRLSALHMAQRAIQREVRN
jgi:NHL repeat